MTLSIIASIKTTLRQWKINIKALFLIPPQKIALNITILSMKATNTDA